MDNHSSSVSRKPEVVAGTIVLLVVFILLCCGQMVAARTEQNGGVVDRPQFVPEQGYNAITITPSIRELRDASWLPASVETEEGSVAPLGKRTRLTISAESGLRAWGVAVEAVAFEGPHGKAPSGRLLVRTELMGGKSRPLEGGVPVLLGDYRLPSLKTDVEISFAPTWQDPAGEYRGKLLIRPFVPGEPGVRVIAADPPGGLIGTDQGVEFTFYHGETIMIECSTNEVFVNVPGAQVEQEAECEVTFWVWTNSDNWRVICSAGPLVLEGGGHDIPASRITWERLDGLGRVVQSGNLESTAILLDGRTPAAGEESTLRFGVQVVKTDVAGRYGGRLDLAGLIEGASWGREGETEISTPTQENDK